jgi:hypothetical protein
MKHLKTYKSQLKTIDKSELNKILIDSIYLEENINDNKYYKVNEKADNWFYKIKYYYRKPGYKTYCFVTNDGEGIWMSRVWIEEDKLLIPTEEEIEKFLILKNSNKYNL